MMLTNDKVTSFITGLVYPLVLKTKKLAKSEQMDLLAVICIMLSGLKM